MYVVPRQHEPGVVTEVDRKDVWVGREVSGRLEAILQSQFSLG